MRRLRLGWAASTAGVEVSGAGAFAGTTTVVGEAAAGAAVGAVVGEGADIVYWSTLSCEMVTWVVKMGKR